MPARVGQPIIDLVYADADYGRRVSEAGDIE